MAKAPKSGEIIAKMRPDVNDRPRQVRSFHANDTAHVMLQPIVGLVPAVVCPIREASCSHGRTQAKLRIFFFICLERVYKAGAVAVRSLSRVSSGINNFNTFRCGSEDYYR